MEKLQFLCCCGMTMVKLPSGVWETTLQATKRERDRWLTISILQVKLWAWILHEAWAMLWTLWEKTKSSLVLAKCHVLKKTRALTERVDEFAECYCEAASWLMESEEQHGDILRWPCDWSRHSGFAVIRITLVQRKKMVLCAGKLLALHNPAIKYLQDKKKKSLHLTASTAFSVL